MLKLKALYMYIYLEKATDRVASSVVMGIEEERNTRNFG